MNWLTSKKLLIAIFLVSALPLRAQDTDLLACGKWSQEIVAEGIVLCQAAFDGNLFGASQYLSILEIAPGARFDIVPAADGSLETTSVLAARAGAVAAVNGSFFNMSAPYGSVNYLRIDGETVSPNLPESELKHRRSIRQTGAVATARGALHVLKGDELPSWESYIAAEDVVTTGPLLSIDGLPEPVADDRFNTTRHPRTAVGRRPDGTVLLVVADGRSSHAAGLSMKELQQVMSALGCTSAINLDGGGSTTMVVRGAVVNHPSDNRQFDTDGERPVANAIVVSF